MPPDMAERTKTLIQSVAFWSLLLGIAGGVINVSIKAGRVERDMEYIKQECQRVRNLEERIIRIESKLGLSHKTDVQIAKPMAKADL